MNYLENFYPEARFGGFTNIDGTVVFYSRVNALLTPESVVLDIGCGRGAQAGDQLLFRRYLRVLRGKCKQVIGIDVDPTASANPFVDEFRLITTPPWPVEDASVDLCICDSVLEHVEDPAALFAECRRVLRPGGYLCLRTPNVMSYFGLLTRLIPTRLHGAVLRRAQPDRKDGDGYPVFFKCNTKWTLARHLSEHGFEHFVYGYEPEPAYLSFSRFAYMLGVLYQRIAPSTFRSTLVAYARRT